MTKMEISETSISLLAATKKHVTPCHLRFGERAKRVVRTASEEVASAVQDAAHVLRIMILLRSAKDFPSILRLYGIESSSKTE
jgi:hypothetical protein